MGMIAKWKHGGVRYALLESLNLSVSTNLGMVGVHGEGAHNMPMGFQEAQRQERGQHRKRVGEPENRKGLYKKHAIQKGNPRRTNRRLMRGGEPL